MGVVGVGRGCVCLGLDVLAILGLMLLSLSSNLPQTVSTTSLRIYVINQLATCATIRVCMPATVSMCMYVCLCVCAEHMLLSHAKRSKRYNCPTTFMN